jgi:hypothetical protein
VTRVALLNGWLDCFGWHQCHKACGFCWWLCGWKLDHNRIQIKFNFSIFVTQARQHSRDACFPSRVLACAVASLSSRSLDVCIVSLMVCAACAPPPAQHKNVHEAKNPAVLCYPMKHVQSILRVVLSFCTGGCSSPLCGVPFTSSLPHPLRTVTHRSCACAARGGTMTDHYWRHAQAPHR